MTVPKTFEIEQSSIEILRSLLPKSWLIQEQKPDYSYIDFHIQIVKNTELTGVYFAVQLKGTENLRIRKNEIKFSLPSKHLEYYSRKVKSFPVFLIIVDVIKREAFWLFIQKYLKEDFNNKHWETQKNVNLNIPISNTMENLDLFEEYIIKANEYMKELWPSSLSSAVKNEYEYLRNLDSRFEIDYRIHKGSVINAKLIPIEPLKVKFNIKEKKNFEKIISKSYEKIELTKNDFDITGSELIKHLVDKSEIIELSFNNNFPEVDVYLVISEVEKGTYNNMIFFKGKFQFCNSVFKLSCQVNDSPLQIDLLFYTNESNRCVINFDFNPTKWIYKLIETLPYLEKLFNYFQQMKYGKDGYIIVENQGIELYRIKINEFSNSDQLVNKTYESLLFFKKIKDIDSFYKLNMNVPDLSIITYDDIYDIDELYDLVTKKEHLIQREINGSFEIKESEDFFNNYKEGLSISLEHNGRYNFFNKEINIGEYVININNAKITEYKEVIEDNGKFIQCKFVTDENSQVIMKYLENV